MHSEAFGSVWAFSKKFKFFLDFLNRFSTFSVAMLSKNFFHGIIVLNTFVALYCAVTATVVVLCLCVGSDVYDAKWTALQNRT